MESSNDKKILILGSGMMVEPLIDYLLKRENNRIVIGTNTLNIAQNIIDKRQGRKISAEEIDVMQEETKLRELIKASDLVVSYVPPFLHDIVGKACLVEKRNMITTSYVPQAFKNIENQVKMADLIFMNEIGLDPGIDHLVTHKAINEAKERGEKIIHYESWCGALCSPEFLNNPLLYKFTWAPRGALLALKNEVKQWIDNKVFSLPNNELLIKTVNKQFHSCFNFEGYYNRDSLTYKELYDLKDAETVVRGTIRFKGFGFVFQCFKHLGLFDDIKLSENIENWRDYFYIYVIKKNTNIIKNFEEKYVKGKELLISEAINGIEIHEAEFKFYYELTLIALSKFSESYINENKFETLFSRFYASLKYLDVYKEENKVNCKLLIYL
jgi:saccharopine dehydrogenase (NADP+, L-glutamate forming)